MAIDALGNDAARELLAATAPRLPRCVQRGLLSAAAGNPLAIVELARAISPLRDAGLSSGSAFPLSDRLVKAFAGSVAELAPATQALLLVASADPDCGVSELLDAARAASDQPVSVQSIQEAVDAGVVDMDATGIRFRYPLAGAAIYQRASIAERAKAHASLAAVVDDDTARRARHRAAAAVEPDEAVFSELVGAAATAHRCGEALGALTGLLRASGLTRDRERRAEVLLRAGEIAYELGDRRTALNLIARTDSGGRGPSGHGRLMAVRGVVEPTDPVESAHIEVLCRAADDARAAGDIELASKLVSQAAFRCWMGGQSGRHGELVRHNAGGLGFAPADSRLIAILAWAQPADDGADLLERLELSELEPRDTEKLHFLGSAAHALGDLPRASTHFDQLEESYRSSTRVGLLIPVLVGRMGWRLHTDDWDRIGANAEEAATLVEETGDHRWADAIAVTRAMLAARRGDHREADAVAVDVQRSSHSRGNRLILAAAQHARGVAAIGAGRHDEAFDHLRRVFDPLDPAHHAVLCHWTLSDLAEAAQHAGRLNEARELIAGSAHAFGQSRSPIIQIGRRYAAAVLAEEASAEDHFATALKADLSRWPLERARLQLAYGAWLRRNKRVVESRGPLRAARDAFDALGAVPWARRARDELRATGEQSDQPEFLLHDELTAQEVQIARLAATGLTNRQIGQQLYLSPRTIGSHLYRIFPKLGVVSRSQLRSALASTAEETAAGANRLASFAEGHPRLARAQ